MRAMTWWLAILFSLVFWIAVLVWLPACSDVEQIGPAPEDEFEILQATVFEPSCIACHGVAAIGGYDFRTKEGVLRAVVPFKPEASPLCLSLRGEPGHKAMPPAGPLPTESVEAVCGWVESGAS